MTDQVAAYMEQHHMVRPGDHICAGVSGGADSVCLFLVLERLRARMGFSLSVVHVEHGIRGEDSLRDMRFVRRLGERYGIPVACRSYPVEQLARERGLSVEEAGRLVRYQAFEEEAKRFLPEAARRGNTVKIALAHHGDDNAETMLFHMCRGSGLAGLAGIRPVRGNIIRPLLFAVRQDIEAYLAAEKQEYCVDATNEELVYSRNRIRGRIIPECIRINRQAVAHMNRLAEDAAEAADFLGKQAEIILSEGIVGQADGELLFSLRRLDGCPPVLRRQVMLELIAAAAGSKKDIGREHAQMLLELAEGKAGRQASLPYGLLAEKTYEALRLFPAGRETEFQGLSYPLAPLETLRPGQWEELVTEQGKFCYRVFSYSKKDAEIPKKRYTKWFDYDKIKNSLCLRTRETGDYFCLDAAGHRQKLKKYWMNEKTPRTLRERTLLLAEGAHILWIVGGRISSYYKITEATGKILEVQYMEEKI